MKSAFELALERSGGKLSDISKEKKDRLAEIDRKYKSKIAEAELSAQDKLKKVSDPAKAEEINEGLITEIASLKDRCERDKNAVRNED